MKHPKSTQNPFEVDENNDGIPSAIIFGIAMVVGMIVVFAVAFITFSVGFSAYWMAFPVGSGLLVPLAIGIAIWWEKQQQTDTRRVAADVDASSPERELSILREQYARGVIDETVFEARVERLLNTESVSDAAHYVDRERYQERERENERI